MFLTIVVTLIDVKWSTCCWRWTKF